MEPVGNVRGLTGIVTYVRTMMIIISLLNYYYSQIISLVPLNSLWFLNCTMHCYERIDQFTPELELLNTFRT